MKNLIVTVNGVAYNVTVEEGTGAPEGCPRTRCGSGSRRCPRRCRRCCFRQGPHAGQHSGCQGQAR